MLMKADMTQRVLKDPPPDRRCDSGHSVPEDAIFQGKPTRFLKVTGQGVSGTYCEPCLVVANFLASARRNNDVG